MKNLYAILGVSNKACLSDIAKSYLGKCMDNPSYCFYYTKVFKILVYTPYRLIYDAIFYGVDIRTILFLDYSLREEDEYELAFTIKLIDYFKDVVYDTKYYYKNIDYIKMLDEWYDELVGILDYLRANIKSFYLN